MKIGIVTITELDNYGNRLQNYALQEILKSMGHTVETIPNYITYGYRKSKKYQIKTFIHGILTHNRKMIYDIIKQWRFSNFDKKHFTFSEYYSDIHYISPELNKSYDLFIAGSDQIWNPYFLFNLDFNFLQFADKNKRTAYSASFGVDKIPIEKIELFYHYLSGFSNISVREYEGSVIVKDLIAREVPVLPDPTLLLSHTMWKCFEIKPKWIHKTSKYILVYYLGEKNRLNQTLNQLFNKYPELKRIKIIHLNDYYSLKVFTIQPQEFLWLIDHAELVITDSFHGTVFSILLKTPFMSVERSGTVSMNSRVKSLYRMLNISESNDIIREHIVSNNMLDKKLHNQYIKAINYLQISINSVNN